MIALTLAETAELAGGDLVDGDPAAPLTGQAFVDSRRAVPGGLFVAIAGEHVDGHDYAAAAYAAGAVAALVSRPVGGPAIVVPDVVAALGRLASAVLARLPGPAVIGITGSQGKTSTKDMLASIMAAAGPTVAPEQSLNNEIGVPLTVLRAEPATRFLVVEMGAADVGHIAYLASMVAPRTGVVLNVGKAHLGRFGSREAIATAKGELVEALPADGLAVLNADDERVDAMAVRTRASVLRFGTADRADLRYRVLGLDAAARVSVRLHWQGHSRDVATHYVGAHQAGNAAAAATAALGHGLDLDDVCASLAAARPASHWRMEVVQTEAGVTVVNDAYNANPDSVRAALDAVKAIAAGTGARRLVVVLGPMLELGAAADGEHFAVGRAAADHGAGLVLAVGDVARGVADGARATPGWAGRAFACDDADDAYVVLSAQLSPGDLVLVKGSRAAGLETLAARLAQLGDAQPAAADPADAQPAAAEPQTVGVEPGQTGGRQNRTGGAA